MMYYQMTTNSAANGNLTLVTNNWNNSSKCLWTNKGKYQDQFFACSKKLLEIRNS